MTTEEKKTQLGQFLLTKGILAPDKVEAEIANMAGQLAPATAAEKGLTSDIDKAYEVMMIQKGSVAPQNTTEVSTQPTRTVSAAEQKQINMTLIQQQSTRAAVSANSSVEKYVIDRPAPSEYIPANATGVIPVESWKKIEEQWGGKVLPDDDEIKSTTNYNQLKAAAEAGTPVAVYVGKQTFKPIGYIINKGSAVGVASQPVQMTKEQAENFLALEAAGYILSSDTKPGLKLRFIKEHASKSKPGQFIPAKTVLADANKKAAIEAGAYVVSREVTDEVKETGLKSDLCFKVDTGKPKANGNGNIIRTIRVTVKSTVKTLERKSDFVDVFGTGKKESNKDLGDIPTGKQLENITRAQQNAIIDLRAKLADPTGAIQVGQYADQLKAFDAPAGQAMTPVL